MSALNIDGTPARSVVPSFHLFQLHTAAGACRHRRADRPGEGRSRWSMASIFDHADVYGCDGGGEFGDAEILFGKVLADASATG